MKTYGQYCPLAHTAHILGDRWTLLIVRDLMLGIHHFNDLERGLPGISRALLSKRLQYLQSKGIIEKRVSASGRQTEYLLTEAGWDLEGIIEAMFVWGTKWAFDDPEPEELDPVLLMWWLHRNVNSDQLPADRVVAQFDLHGANRALYGAESMTFWLILSRQDVTLCITDPGFEVNVLVTADVTTLYKVWAGRMSFQEALACQRVQLDGTPALTPAFPHWFVWNDYMAYVRSKEASQDGARDNGTSVSPPKAMKPINL